MLLCPPQHGKSTLASRRAPAYLLGLNPSVEIISASASAPLAEEFGGDVRNCIASPAYRSLFPAVRLSEDSQARGRWRTDQGGGYYAVGIGGALMGRGGELGIIDDPFSSWEDAQSELSRKRVWDWYTGTFYNRIRPGGSIAVIQHRMHEDDLVGLLAQSERHGGDKWKVIKLPADLDNPPWPERYDRAALERIKSNTELRKWSSLYMQDPSPEEGDYFKREWLRRYKDVPRQLNVYMSGDFAVSDGEGDYTELGVWGVDPLDNIYALDWWHGRKTADVWIDALLDMASRWQPMGFIGEMGPIRRAIEPLLERRMRERGVYVVPEWLPHGKADKAAHARPFQGMCSMGRVYFPHTDWAERVIDQCLRFPAGRYDDAVDTCALFGRHIARTWAAQEEPKPPPEIKWDTPITMGELFKSAKKAVA